MTSGFLDELMASKKKKQKYIRQVSPAEMVNEAGEQLRRGEVDRALENLRSAEAQMKPRAAADGKKISIPPHIVAAQAALPPLLAQALAAHALIAASPAERLADLAEAAKYAPEEMRYRVALGAGRLLAQDAEAAFGDFEKAEEMQPGDALATRAFALGLLAAGRGREVVDLLNRTPEAQRNESWRRLAAICSLANGNVAPAGVDKSRNQLLSGLHSLAAGDRERAQAHWAEIPTPDHNPTRVEAAQMATQFFYSGALSFETQRYEAAAADWREAHRLLRKHHLQLPWRDRLAVYYHKVAENVWRRNLPLAIECWQEAASILPGDPTAQANLNAAREAQAQQAWHNGQVEQAAALWQELLETKPNDERLLRSLAVAAEKLGRKSEAVGHWRALSRVWRQQAKQRANEPGFKDRLLQLEQHVVKLMIEADVEGQEIVAELESALKFDPDNLELRLRTADSLMGIGRTSQALKHLDAAEKQHGVSVDLLMRRGTVYSLLRRKNDAHTAFERAIELDSENIAARRAYLVLLGREAVQAEDRGNTKQAIAICEKQLKLDPKYEPAMVHLAGLYFEDYRDKEAKQLLQRVVENNPNDPQVLVRVANVYLECGMEKEATQLFQKAIEVDPSPICFFNIGLCYWKEDKEKSAFKYFDRAAEAATTKDVDLLIEIGKILAETGKMKDGERFFKRAMAIDPSNPVPHYVRAIALLGIPTFHFPSAKEMDEAKRELEEAMRLAAEKPEYAALAEELQGIIKILNNMPLGFGGPTGRPPGGSYGLPPPVFFDEDEDDDDELEAGDPMDEISIEELLRIFSPPKKKKKKRK